MYEQRIIHLLNEWVVVVLPITVVLLRLALFRMSGQMEEMYRNLFAIPQDLVFIAVSFVLAGVSRTIPAYAKHYPSDNAADLASILQVLLFLLLAFIVMKMQESVTFFYQRMVVCWKQIKRHDQGKRHKDEPVSRYVSVRLFTTFIYVLFISMLIMVEVLIGGGCVAYSLQLIK